MLCDGDAQSVPRFSVREKVVMDRELWGGRLVAAVPTVLTVDPLPGDEEPLDYKLELTLDVVDGRLHCVGLCAHRLPGGPPITSEGLRRVAVGRYVQMAAIELDLVHELRQIDQGVFKMEPFEPPPADFAKNGMTEEALSEVSRLYVWASATGDRPYGLLERQYGLPRAKAARWIATARRRGILPEEAVDSDGS